MSHNPFKTLSQFVYLCHTCLFIFLSVDGKNKLLQKMGLQKSFPCNKPWLISLDDTGSNCASPTHI